MLLRLLMLLGIVGLSWASKSVQTYKIIGGSLGQQVTSSALIWEQYYGDSKQLRYAVESGKFSSETEVGRMELNDPPETLTYKLEIILSSPELPNLRLPRHGRRNPREWQHQEVRGQDRVHRGPAEHREDASQVRLVGQQGKWSETLLEALEEVPANSDGSGQFRTWRTREWII